MAGRLLQCVRGVDTVARLGGDEFVVLIQELSTDWVGTHLSCRNLDRPGWCFVSDSLADAPRARTGGFDEIFAGTDSTQMTGSCIEGL